MAYNEFDYRFTGMRARPVATASNQERTPSKRSIAKKKWWAEKRERERKAAPSKD